MVPSLFSLVVGIVRRFDMYRVRYVFHETVYSNPDRNNFYSANREQTSFTQITANIEVLCSGNPIEFGAQQCLLTNRSLKKPIR